MFFAFGGNTSPPQSSSKTQKHGSGHGNRRSGAHSKSSKGTTPSSRAAAHGGTARSFLFVVNEFRVDYERLPGDAQPLTDQWLNPVPPERAEAYLGEMVGTVFRYLNGVISPAHGYVWHRPVMGLEGRIVRINQAGVIDGYPAVYGSQTIFACSALLPVIVTDGDVSLGYTFLRRLCRCDQRFDESYSPWFPLHFERRDQEGVSYINSRACGTPFVAGKDPSWIPSLVPGAYRNTDPTAAPPSRGLSGNLCLILALMGFHGRPGRASDVFRDRKWNLGQWVGSGRPSSYLPKSGESPRGLLVQVCTDNLVDGQPDSEESNRSVEECIGLIQDLEYRSILVQG